MIQTPFMVGPNFQELNRLIAKDDFELQTQIRNVLRLLRPHHAKGYEKARFGSGADGGYVHLEDFEGIDTAISLGIDVNISWDRDVADRGLKVYQFDHTVDDPAPADTRMVFHKTMIAPATGEGTESLESIVNRLDKGLSRPNILLKMDIESAEWPVLEATSLHAISRFSQITCELHNFGTLADLEWRQLIFRGLRKISKFYAPIHIHANNYAGFAHIANVIFPHVIEVTFVNRGLYQVEISDEIFPGSLDTPCNPHVPDMFLGDFRY